VLERLAPKSCTFRWLRAWCSTSCSTIAVLCASHRHKQGDKEKKFARPNFGKTVEAARTERHRKYSTADFLSADSAKRPTSGFSARFYKLELDSLSSIYCDNPKKNKEVLGKHSVLPRGGLADTCRLEEACDVKNHVRYTKVGPMLGISASEGTSFIELVIDVCVTLY
jgi:hypothetical protein